jgi:HD-like signal output (HDOD) protein
MAVPVLAASHADRYVDLYHRHEVEESSLLQEMERDAFGYDHAEVGAMMAETWNLPETLITAIADHHQSGQRAPAAVEAVAFVRHAEPPDELGAFRVHCQQHLHLVEPQLDSMIEAAEAESSSLADSIRPGAVV